VTTYANRIFALARKVFNFAVQRDIVDTNLGPADIADLAKLGATLEGKDLYGMVIRYPLVDDWVTPQGGMVQLPDLPAINIALDNAWERAPLQETNSEERLCP